MPHGVDFFRKFWYPGMSVQLHAYLQTNILPEITKTWVDTIMQIILYN